MTDLPPSGRRVLGPITATAVVAGSMLGIGIFITTPTSAAAVPDTWAFFAVWIFAGLTAFAGATACAELGTMMPRAGGDYVYIREAFGRSASFAAGWTLFAAVFTGSIAVMSVPLCQFQLPVLLEPIVVAASSEPVTLDLHRKVGPLTWIELFAILIIVLFTTINSLGARTAGWVQAAMTALPFVAMLLIGIAAFTLDPTNPPKPAPPDAELSLSGFVAAYTAVYFAYAGWNASIYIAGEIKEPARTLPISLIGGTIGVTLLYVVLGGAFVYVLGLGGLAEAGEAGSALAAELGGPKLRVVMTALIAIVLLASINGTILGGARVIVAMAQGGALPAVLGKLSGKRETPVRALWAQAILAILLVVSGSFESLLKLASLAMLVTGTLMVGSLYVLRIRKTNAARPHRALGYPVLPAIYILSSVFVMVVAGIEALGADELGDLLPLLGLGVFAVAAVAHFVATRLVSRS